MSRIPSRILSTEQLLRLAQLQLDDDQSLPLSWQAELVRRLADAQDGVLQPEQFEKDPRQLELFSDN